MINTQLLMLRYILVFLSAILTFSSCQEDEFDYLEEGEFNQENFITSIEQVHFALQPKDFRVIRDYSHEFDNEGRLLKSYQNSTIYEEFGMGLLRLTYNYNENGIIDSYMYSRYIRGGYEEVSLQFVDIRYYKNGLISKIIITNTNGSPTIVNFSYNDNNKLVSYETNQESNYKFSYNKGEMLTSIDAIHTKYSVHFRSNYTYSEEKITEISSELLGGESQKQKQYYSYDSQGRILSYTGYMTKDIYSFSEYLSITTYSLDDDLLTQKTNLSEHLTTLSTEYFQYLDNKKLKFSAKSYWLDYLKIRKAEYMTGSLENLETYGYCLEVIDDTFLTSTISYFNSEDQLLFKQKATKNENGIIVVDYWEDSSGNEVENYEVDEWIKSFSLALEVYLRMWI